MKNTIEKILKIDRRLIFLALTLLLVFPIVRPLGLPNKNIGNEVKSLYERIEGLPAGSFLMLSLDYDPATRPELHPQAVAVIKHAFRKDLRIMILTLNAGATGLIDEIGERIPKDIAPTKKYGTDYVILPYQPNPVAVMTQLGMDMFQIYDKDRDGALLKEMPVMKGIRNVKDMQLGMCITGTAHAGLRGRLNGGQVQDALRRRHHRRQPDRLCALSADRPAEGPDGRHEGRGRLRAADRREGKGHRRPRRAQPRPHHGDRPDRGGQHHDALAQVPVI